MSPVLPASFSRHSKRVPFDTTSFSVSRSATSLALAPSGTVTIAWPDPLPGSNGGGWKKAIKNQATSAPTRSSAMARMRRRRYVRRCLGPLKMRRRGAPGSPPPPPPPKRPRSSGRRGGGAATEGSSAGAADFARLGALGRLGRCSSLGASRCFGGCSSFGGCSGSGACCCSGTFSCGALRDLLRLSSRSRRRRSRSRDSGSSRPNSSVGGFIPSPSPEVRLPSVSTNHSLSSAN